MEKNAIICHSHRAQLEEECKDIFLSHSRFQKSFVEQLHRDLCRENMSSFLDKDPHCLPKGRPFPSRIFSNARNCKVAVLVLSSEFLSSKWPMLELSAIVNAQKFSNPDLAIMPLFFKISVKALKEKLKNQELLPKWKELQEEDDRINCEEWCKALKEICKINGMEYSEDEGEVVYRDRIVDHIRLLLPPNLKYDDSLVQGKTRLCQEVANLFESAELRNGVKVVGLYGIAGSGKTTISMSLCNFYSHKFKGKVFHAELDADRERCKETQKQALKALTNASDSLLNSVTSMQQASQLLRRRMPNHKVFMAIDNISDASLSIEAAQSYLSAGFKEGSMILLTARSPVILKRLLREEGGLLKHVPILEDEEAMGILLKLTYVEVADLTCAEREVARHCISKCCFGSTYHPLALQAFGTYLFDKFGPHLLKWNEIPDFRDTTGREVEEVFSVFELSFKDLSPRYIKIFMLVALYLPHSLSRQSLALSWLAVLCNERTGCIHDVINHLKKKGLIEEDNSSGHVRVHDLIRDFAESKANESWRSWCCLRGVEEVTTCFKQSLLHDSICLEGIKFSNCSFGSLPLSSYNFELFANVVVLNLENICQLRSLNLCSMKVLRSLVIRDCGELKEIEGIEHSPNLAWIEVAGFNQLVKAPQIEGLTSLRRFCWDTQRRRQPMGASVDAPTTTRLGDVGKCVLLEYIDIACESLQEFPNLEGLPNLREIHFRDLSEVVNGCPQRQDARLEDNPGLTDASNSTRHSRLHDAHLGGCSTMTIRPKLGGCSQLQLIWLEGCFAMTAGPDLSGCSQLRHAWFLRCSAMTSGPHLSGCLQLQDVSFRGCSAMTTGPDLSGCSQLQRAGFRGCSAMTTGPGFSGCSQLQRAGFRGCSAMISAPDLSACSQLQCVSFHRCSAMIAGPDLSGCSQLQRASFDRCSAMTVGPDLNGCSQLQIVSFDGCSAMTTGPDLSGCLQLQIASFDGCSAMSIGPGLRRCAQLQRSSFDGCSAMITGPDLSGCSQLQRASFDGCSAMTTVPHLSGCSQLQYVLFRGCSAMTAGPDLSGFSQLRNAFFEGCSAMTCGPDLSGCSQIRKIRFEGCSAMTAGPHLSGCSQLRKARFEGCSAMTTSPNLSGCSRLQLVFFDGCSAMTAGPDLSGCSQLQRVSFDGCSAMTTSPDLSGCSKLLRASFDGCSAMTTGPDLSGCSQLQLAYFRGFPGMSGGLDVSTCTRLTFLCLQGLQNLDFLNRLTALRLLELIECDFNDVIDITNCKKLEDLRVTKCEGLTTLLLSFADLSSLRTFTLRDCEGVVDPPDVTKCRHIENVEIRSCPSLTRFPSFAGLRSLKRLVLRECGLVDTPPDVSGCTGLQELELRDNPKMERLPWMLDCTCLSHVDVSWGIAVDPQRTPQQLRTCPIFRNAHCLTKRFGLHSLANKYYRFATIQLNRHEPQVLP